MIGDIASYGNILIRGTFAKIAYLEDEWFIDVDNPKLIIEYLGSTNKKVDILTFWQRLPYVEPRFDFYREWDSIAVIPIDTYEQWWSKQISDKGRNMVRKSAKKGVEIKVVKFNDELVDGIAKVYNETPIRQGRKFSHYGESFSEVKRESSDRIENSEFLGAYYHGELIGFIKLLYTDRYAMIVLILSMIRHRDKSPTNALVAKSVEVCAQKGFRHLVYAFWLEGGLGEFKRQNGFKKVSLPRYYIPLSVKGKFLLKSNLHHGLSVLLPNELVSGLKELRKKMYMLRYR